MTDINFKHIHIGFKTLFALILSAMISQKVNAQISDVHMDISYNLDYFTNLDGIEFETPNNGFALRAGMNWVLAGNQDFYLGTEIGYSQRQLQRHLGATKFEFSFYATDISIITGWRITEKLSTEFGLGGSVYGVTLFENDGPKDMGDGFNNHDVYTTLGCSYNFYKFLSVGTRLRYGFIPALEYEPIGDYGEIGEERSVFNQLTWGFFLRANFYRLK